MRPGVSPSWKREPRCRGGRADRSARAGRTNQPTALTERDTQRLTRHGLRLAQFTVVYNVAEGVVAITAGLLAGLVSLVGFGVDSGIESLAAVLVGLRLPARLRHGITDERKERRALEAVAVTFFILAAYVVVEGARSLLGDEEPDTSTVGLVLLAASIVVMPLLATPSAASGWRSAVTSSSSRTPRRPRSAYC
jgi:divalent metal cation (Fe/Co/Zn/Cd) transporter